MIDLDPMITKSLILRGHVPKPLVLAALERKEARKKSKNIGILMIYQWAFSSKSRA